MNQITVDKQLLKDAIRALEGYRKYSSGLMITGTHIYGQGTLDRLRTALEAPVLDEPYGWIGEQSRLLIRNVGQRRVNGTALYTRPPQREWVGLTDKEIEDCIHHVDKDGIGLFAFAEAVSAKLKERNCAN